MTWLYGYVYMIMIVLMLMIICMFNLTKKLYKIMFIGLFEFVGLKKNLLDY